MSKLEETFVRAWKRYGLGKLGEREYRFSKTRKFRFDFAWPKQKVAVEIDGIGLGHGINNVRGFVGAAIKSLSQDHERQNHAAELGWIVLRYTSRQLGSEAKRRAVIEQVLLVLENRRAISKGCEEAGS